MLEIEKICPAITLYFQWICLVSSFRSDDAWFVNEIPRFYREHSIVWNCRMSWAAM